MLDHEAYIMNYNSDVSDETIHKFAATYLLSRYDSELILSRGSFAYRVKGGEDGHLYYKKRNNGDWFLIANWCFYGLYIVVRYRKPVWLKPMYQSLFAKMNFVSVIFFNHSIELVGTEGEILRSRRFRLCPPFALNKVMTEKCGYTQEKVEELKAELCL